MRSGYSVCSLSRRSPHGRNPMKDQIHRTQRRPLAGWGLFALVGVLLCFGALNIAVRATSHKLEDGVLWEARPEGVTAAEVAARGGAMAAGIRPGDVLVAIDGAPSRRSRTCSARSPARRSPIRCPTPCFASASSGCSTSRSRRCPAAIRRCMSSARRSASSRCSSAPPCGCGGRNDPATLHFFWLCLAFFGTLTFSFSRLDRLDWYFYWADVVATLAAGAAVPPLHAGVSRSSRARGFAARAGGSSRCCMCPPACCLPSTSSRSAACRTTPSSIRAF